MNGYLAFWVIFCYNSSDINYIIAQNVGKKKRCLKIY